MFCKNCGGELPENSAFCPLCGTRIQAAQSERDHAESREVCVEKHEAAAGFENCTRHSDVPDAAAQQADVRTKPKRFLRSKKGLLIAAAAVIAVVVLIVSGGDKADVVLYPCDNGAVLDMDLDAFSNRFSKSVKKYEKADVDLSSLWMPPSFGKEDSGASYQLYAASPYTDVQLYAKTIDDKMAGIIISPDYSSENYKDNLHAVGNLFLHAADAFGMTDADEAQDILKKLTDGCDAAKGKTSYICDRIKYTINPDRVSGGNSRVIGYTLTIEPVSSDYVSALTDNIIYSDF